MIASEGQVLRPGALVQIDPAHDARFGGLVLVVEDVRPWGVMGYVPVPQGQGQARAYYKVEWAHVERVGELEWVPADVAGPQS